MAKKTTLKSVGKGIIYTSKKVLPVVGKGLNKVGSTAKSLAVKSAPIVENGVSVVYGTMAKGFDLGVQGVKNVAKGAKNVTKGMSKRRRSKNNRKNAIRTRRR